MTDAQGATPILQNRAGEDRNPVLDPATGAVYILSERDGGTFNVYTFPLDAPDKAEKLTDFTTHPVRFLSRADNGTMAFTWDGEIYTMANGGKPRKVAVTVTSDDEPAVRRLQVSPTADAAVSPTESRRVHKPRRCVRHFGGISYNPPDNLHSSG